MQPAEKMPVWLICQNALLGEGLRRTLEDHEFVVTRLLTSDNFDKTEDEDGSGEDLLILDCASEEGCAERHANLRARFPSARIVVLCDKLRLEDVVDAFRAGVDGYLLKEIGCPSLVGSLRLIRLGEKVMPSELIQHLSSGMTPACAIGSADADVAQLLSDREVETLRYLIQGFPNKVIAHRLDISEATVKVHVKAILRKLMVQNRTQAAIWAVSKGLDGALVAEDDAGEGPQPAEWAQRPIRGETALIEPPAMA